MKKLLFDSLKCIPRSWALMMAQPTFTISVMALAAILSIAALSLGNRLGLPEQLSPDDIEGMFKRSLLNLAVLFPLELYFLPRWAIAADSCAPDAFGTLSREVGRNTKENWKQLFEERWGRVFLARIFVAIAASIGFFLFIVPGILVLVFFGWTPWRVLLRGEPILAAAKAAARSMAMLWPQVLVATAAILAIILLFNNMVAFVASQIGGALEWQISNACVQASMVWMNAALLGLFQWMEAAREANQLTTTDI